MKDFCGCNCSCFANEKEVPERNIEIGPILTTLSEGETVAILEALLKGQGEFSVDDFETVMRWAERVRSGSFFLAEVVRGGLTVSVDGDGTIRFMKAAR